MTDQDQFLDDVVDAVSRNLDKIKINFGKFWDLATELSAPNGRPEGVPCWDDLDHRIREKAWIHALNQNEVPERLVRAICDVVDLDQHVKEDHPKGKG